MKVMVCSKAMRWFGRARESVKGRGMQMERLLVKCVLLLGTSFNDAPNNDERFQAHLIINTTPFTYYSCALRI